MTTLSSLSDLLNEETGRLLGDPITYTRYGMAPASINAFADHSDTKRDFGLSSAVSADAAIEVSKADVPEWHKLDEIVLPETGSTLYLPKEVKTDSTGLNWLMLLKRKAD